MSSPSSQSPWEFLIVSRDSRMQAALTHAVQSVGGTVNVAADTASALSYITSRKLDGIFLDTRVESGLSLVGSIRRGNSNRFAAVFACAGEDEDINRLLNAGVNFVLHRPLESAEVTAVLKNARQMILGERQRYQRHQVSLPVTLKAGDQKQRAVTRNLSRGGMAVRCQESLAAGSALEFELELPSLEPIRGRGEVAWSHPAGVMGIRFYRMGEEVRAVLWRWMEQESSNGKG